MKERLSKRAAVSAGTEIPDKLYFRIGEVSQLAGVKPYVLRFWETEFSGIAPKKSGTGHRLYRRKDIELILVIKELLHERRFTIEGARKLLASQPRPKATTAVVPAPQRELFPPPTVTVEEIRRELLGILKILQS